MTDRGASTHEYAVANGHPPVARRTICVDFDSTIIPWGQSMFDDSDPLPGAAEAIREWKKRGFRIIIFTSRLSRTWWKAEGWDFKEAQVEQMDYIIGILDKHGIPYDGMTAEKIPAIAYIDDKAIEFTGDNWAEIQERVANL